MTVMADTNTVSRNRLLGHAQEVFADAQKLYETEPTNNVAAWQFARAAFNRGEFSTNDTERATCKATNQCEPDRHAPNPPCASLLAIAILSEA